MYLTMRISFKRWDDCMYAQYSCFLKKWQADTSSSCRRSRNVQYNWSGWFDNQSETRRSEKRDNGRNKKLRKAYLFGKTLRDFQVQSQMEGFFLLQKYENYRKFLWSIWRWISVKQCGWTSHLKLCKSNPCRAREWGIPFWLTVGNSETLFEFISSAFVLLLTRKPT